MYLVPLLAVLEIAAAGVVDAPIRIPKDYLTFVPPALGGSYTDTSFGASVKRLSDARRTTNAWLSGLLDFVSTEYPGASPFNSRASQYTSPHPTRTDGSS